MKTQNLYKVIFFAAIGIAVIFLINCFLIINSQKQAIVKQTLNVHQELETYIQTTINNYQNIYAEQNKSIQKKHNSFIKLYLRDKLSLLLSYTILVPTQQSPEDPEQNNTSNNTEAQTVANNTQKTLENQEIKINYDNDEIINNLDIIYAVYSKNTIRTDKQSEFILDLTDENNIAIKDLLKNAQGDVKEHLINLKNENQKFYGLMSSDQNQSSIVVVNANRKIINIKSKSEDEIITTLCQIIKNYLDKKSHLNYAIYIGNKLKYSNDEKLNTVIDDFITDQNHSILNVDTDFDNELTSFLTFNPCNLKIVLSSNLDSDYDLSVISYTAIAFILISLILFIYQFIYLSKIPKQVKTEFDRYDAALTKLNQYNLATEPNTDEFIKTLNNNREELSDSNIKRINNSTSSLITKIKDNFDVYAKEIKNTSFKLGEYNAAKELQKSVLPTISSMPKTTYIDLAAYLIPANNMGGNFYDIERLDESNISFVIGEVNLKSINGAKVITYLCPKISQLLHSGLYPSKVLTLLNQDLIAKFGNNVNVNLIIGIINEKTGNFILANANFENPIIITQEGLDFVISDPQIALGINATFEYNQTKGILVQSDKLLLHSSGIYSTCNEKGEQYTQDQLLQSIKQAHASDEIDDLLIDIYKALSKFSGTKINSEDLTFIGIKQKSIRF